MANESKDLTARSERPNRSKRPSLFVSPKRNGAAPGVRTTEDRTNQFCLALAIPKSASA